MLTQDQLNQMSEQVLEKEIETRMEKFLMQGTPGFEKLPIEETKQIMYEITQLFKHCSQTNRKELYEKVYAMYTLKKKSYLASVSSTIA